MDNQNANQLPSSELRFLIEIESMLGEPLPLLSEDDDFSFGYICVNRHIKTIHLIRYELEEFPKSIEGLYELGTLYIRNIPKNISLIPNLVHLKVQFLIESKNKNISEIVDLKKLRILEFLGPFIPPLPMKINQLYQLDTLRLYSPLIFDRKLQDLLKDKVYLIPDSIGELYNLKKLYIQNFSCISLPESIRNLINLKELEISRCNCVVRTTNNANLDEKCKIDSVELLKVVSDCVNLTKILLTDINLRSIPLNFDNLINLEELDLSYNHDLHFSKELSKLVNLKKLKFDQSGMKIIPESIWHLTQLRELSLIRFSIIPDQISNLIHLKRLWIGDTYKEKCQISKKIMELAELELLNIGTMDLNDISSILFGINKRVEINIRIGEINPIQYEILEEITEKRKICFYNQYNLYHELII